MMVSSETHDKKPYALPVQCIPYAGLKEAELRRFISELCMEMTSLGFFTCQRIHSAIVCCKFAVIYVICSSSKISLRKMLAMITSKGKLL